VKRHPLDLFSLIAGLAFVAIAVLYLLDAAGQLSVNGRLVIPLLLVALGVAGLAAAVHRMARGQRSASGTTAGTAADPVRAPAHVPADSRYDELSTDLEALGLLDEPDTTGDTRPPRP
jgi:hypothetical protein